LQEDIMNRTALITGANRGIGLETCRQLGAMGHRVVLAARNAGLGEAAAGELADQGLEVVFEQMDVGQPASISACAARLAQAGEAVDILVNNAGVLVEADLLTGDLAAMEDAIAVHVMGPLLTARAFMPGMAQRGWGRVVNFSSAWGSFARGLEGPAPYAITKAAINALTVRLAREAGDGVKVNSVDPGGVQTRMGGPDADRTVEQGADPAVWLATLGDDGPTGGFFRDRETAAW
jgi:NAD(P)-dependent dehydrogenase (short-subunit alcohol dehydrogenase family)